MLETHKHAASSFLTLTYDEVHLPTDGNLSVQHLLRFVARLRSLVGEVPLRYYGVGEYGTKGGRPHYHVALWGLRNENLVESAWKFGFVHSGDITPESSAYILKYLDKGNGRLTHGRTPEFARMSRHPGIGALAVPDLALALSKSGGQLGESGDVPTVVRVGNKLRPLGRYVRGKLREEIGMDRRAPDSALRAAAFDRMREVHGKAGIEAREAKREQEAAVALARVKISNSKRIL